MFAAIRRYQADPDAAGAIARRARNDFLPILRDIPGFRAYYLVHAGGGKYTAISLFADEAGAKAANRRAPVWIRGNLAEFVQGTPEMSLGEVLVEEFVEEVVDERG